MRQVRYAIRARLRARCRDGYRELRREKARAEERRGRNPAGLPGLRLNLFRGMGLERTERSRPRSECCSAKHENRPFIVRSCRFPVLSCPFHVRFCHFHVLFCPFHVRSTYLRVLSAKFHKIRVQAVHFPAKRGSSKPETRNPIEIRSPNGARRQREIFTAETRRTQRRAKA